MTARWLVGGLLSGIVCGCTHLHRPEDQAHIDQAVEAFETAALDSAFDAERELYETLAEEEHALVVRQAHSLRDLRLYQIMANTRTAAQENSGWQILLQEIISRRDEIGRLSCQAEERQRDLRKRRRDRVLEAYRLATLKKTYLMKGKDRAYPPPRCPAPSKKQPPSLLPEDNPHAALHQRLLRTCQQFAAADAKSQACLQASDGLYTRSLADQRRLETERRQIQAALTKRRKDLNTAKRKYDEVKQRSEKDELTDELVKAAKAVREKLDLYDKITEVAPKVDQALGQMEVDTFQAEAVIQKLDEEEALLDAILARIIDKDTPSTAEATGLSSRDTALLFAMATDIPELFDRVENEIERSRLPPLLLAYERNQILRTQAQGRLTRIKRRLKLYRERTEALAKEADILQEAYFALCALLRPEDAQSANCTDAPSPHDQACWKAAQTRPIHQGLTAGPAHCRETLARAVLRFADSWTLARVPQAEIDHRLNRLAYDAQLDESTYALMKWNRLVSIPLYQLAALHAGGVKLELWVEIIGGIVTAAGLGAIAAGVQ